MPRQPRLEYEGAIYHVINRGNYRRRIFTTNGAKEAFLRGLDEVATKLDWRVHAWVIMSNHFHIALETPRGDLVEGMKIWQGTFATRFNRLRSERGHLFQGRYKSLLVEGSDYLGALCHYIHLNPVRARLATAEQLGEWPWSSAHWIEHPKKRPAWFDASESLVHAGGLADNKPGRRAYREYLDFLATDSRAQKELKFESMCQGWVLGSAKFKKSLIEQHEELREHPEVQRTALGPDRDAVWSERLRHHLKKAKRREVDALTEPKSAEWKVRIAAAMKDETTVTNRWLAERLNMGGLHEVSRRVNALKNDSA
ncbi:transposase [Actomonas aquatica]|uniref:Transposase n=1 Tax=Actomonas aquatica TaxID=2866162 RepID=A0ABZ1C9B5_9BACT|nr:transposase [Opitutus sp. WL0086]WRQ87892.1 transposase [Opitutus sp. WL0086]